MGYYVLGIIDGLFVLVVILSVDVSSVIYGSVVILIWLVFNVIDCFVVGVWIGIKFMNGSGSMGVLIVNSIFSLICCGLGGLGS